MVVGWGGLLSLGVVVEAVRHRVPGLLCPVCCRVDVMLLRLVRVSSQGNLVVVNRWQWRPIDVATLPKTSRRADWQGNLARQDHYVIVVGLELRILNSMPQTLTCLDTHLVLHYVFEPLQLSSTLTAMQLSSRQIVAEPYPFPHDASLSPNTTALVVVDMQRDCEIILL